MVTIIHSAAHQIWRGHSLCPCHVRPYVRSRLSLDLLPQCLYMHVPSTNPTTTSPPCHTLPSPFCPPLPLLSLLAPSLPSFFLPPFLLLSFPPSLLQLLLIFVGDFVCWYWVVLITQLTHVSTDVSAHTHKHVNMYTCNDVHVHMYFACNEIHHPMYVACSSNELWYVVCGMWYVVCGMWCVVCGMWYVHGMWHVVHMCLCWNLTSFPTYLLSLCMWVKGRA